MANFDDKPQYAPRGLSQTLAVLVEECGEVVAAKEEE